MSQLNNHVGLKKQLIQVSINSYVSNYQTKVFFNGSNIHNLYNKIITSLQMVSSNELDKVDGNDIVDLTNTDFSTYITLVGKDGKVILNLLPAPFLYVNGYEGALGKDIREFLMLVDWENSYMLFVWSASPVAGSVIAFNVGYVDSVKQLPAHVQQHLN